MDEPIISPLTTHPKILVKTNYFALVIVVILGLVVIVETGLLINDYMYFQAIGEEMPVVQVFRKAKPTVVPTIAPMVTPDATQTANWKTVNFVNPDKPNFHLSFKIPEKWVITSLGEDVTPIQDIANIKIKDGGIFSIMEENGLAKHENIQVEIKSDGTVIPSKSGNNPLFDQILATFRFTK